MPGNYHGRYTYVPAHRCSHILHQLMSMSSFVLLLGLIAEDVLHVYSNHSR